MDRIKQEAIERLKLTAQQDANLLRIIREHVLNAEQCGQGNPIAKLDAFEEIKKLVL
jgi:hypothetical protein